MASQPLTLVKCLKSSPKFYTLKDMVCSFVFQLMAVSIVLLVQLFEMNVQVSMAALLVMQKSHQVSTLSVS